MIFFNKITQNQLFKIVSLNSFSVGLKIGIGLIMSKVFAIFIGPIGMALIGNLRIFLTSLETISILGFQNGIVKYVAENYKDKEKIKNIIVSVFISLLVIIFILSGLLYFFADFWNDNIFGNDFEYSFVFKFLALALPWYAISVFLLAILNGLSKFKKVIWVNIIGNLIGLVISVLMVLQFKVFGALLAIIITPALLFFVTFYFVRKEIDLLGIIKLNLFDFQIIKKLSSYSLMALISSVLGPFVFLAIRTNVIQNLGLVQVGYWEAMTRISTYYLMFVSTILTVYYLPKLAIAQNSKETKKVFWSFYKSILPVFCLGLFIIYFSRFFIIQILFTKEFLPVSSLFFWQLLGDFFKVASLILGYQFFAKKLTKAFVFFELSSFVLLYFLTYIFMKLFGLEGVVMAQAVDNLLYFISLSIYFRKIFLV